MKKASVFFKIIIAIIIGAFFIRTLIKMDEDTPPKKQVYSDTTYQFNK